MLIDSDLNIFLTKITFYDVYILQIENASRFVVSFLFILLNRTIAEQWHSESGQITANVFC
jgi:hypothetical protein